jgi:uncharacterized protein (TIGR02284 family)
LVDYWHIVQQSYIINLIISRIKAHILWQLSMPQIKNTLMENFQENAVSKLNLLISVEEDGKYGYENAAENIEDGFIKRTFLRFASQRASYSSRLQIFVKNIGGVLHTEGEPLESLHRLWDIKSVVASNDKNALINACRTAEEAALKVYKEALQDESITGIVKGLIFEQMKGIEYALKTMTGLTRQTTY